LGTAAGLSTVAGLGAYIGTLAEEGRITGGMPKEPVEAERWRDEKILPYAVKPRGRNTWIQWGRVAPFGPALGELVDFIEGYRSGRELKGKGAGEAAATAVIDALRKNVIFPSGVLGLFNFTNAIEDPDNYLERWTSSLAGSAVPTIVRQAARTMDPRVVGPEGVSETVMAGVPALREHLPQAMGQVTGEGQVYGEALGGEMVSPIFTSEQSQRPIFKLLSAVEGRVTPVEKTISVTIPKDDEASRQVLRAAKARATGEQIRIIKRLLSPAGYSVHLDPAHYQRAVEVRGKLASKEAEGREAEILAMPPDVAQRELQSIYGKRGSEITAILRPIYLQRLLAQFREATP